MNRPVMIMAGGTGGHIFPGLAVARVLRDRNINVVWMGSRHGMEGRLVPAAGLPLEQVPVRALRGKSLLARLAAPFQLSRALLQALSVIRRHRPRSVLSMGGFAAGPGGIAAWLLRRPLVVHEQNALPGLTNRLLSRVAKRLLCGFPAALGPKSEHVGNPVRADIAAIEAPEQRLAKRQPPWRILVLGGSQGAAALNEVVPAAMATLADLARPQVRHQAGKGRAEVVLARYEALGVGAEVEEFIEAMESSYAWADLVICRAGALTIAELAAAGLGAIYVPYPHAVDDHQTHNASHMVAAGAGHLLAESELTAQSLGQLVAQLLNASETKAMAVQARSLARPEAAQAVADALLEVSR